MVQFLAVNQPDSHFLPWFQDDRLRSLGAQVLFQRGSSRVELISMLNDRQLLLRCCAAQAQLQHPEIEASTIGFNSLERSKKVKRICLSVYLDMYMSYNVIKLNMI